MLVIVIMVYRTAKLLAKDVLCMLKVTVMCQLLDTLDCLSISARVAEATKASMLAERGG